MGEIIMEKVLFIKQEEALNELVDRLELDLQSDWGRGFMAGIKEAISIIKHLDVYADKIGE